MWGLAALSVMMWCASALATEPVPIPTAADTAAATLEAFRDAKHREAMRIVWPEGPDAPLPPDFEVLLIKGYIGLNCVRLHRHDGGPILGDRIWLGQTWFYNPEGENFAPQRTEIDPIDFARAWAAANRLVESRCEPLNPPPPPPPRPLPDPDVEEFEEIDSPPEPCRHRSIGSHAPHEWFRIRTGTAHDLVAEGHVRGTWFVDDIQEFDGLRLRAIDKVFSDLLPRPGPQWRRFDAAEWNDGLEQDLVPHVTAFREAHAAGWKDDIDAAARVFCEAALRTLGQTGGESADALAKAFLDHAPPEDARRVYYALSVVDDARRAAERIRFRLHWDAAAATAAIHGNNGKYHADNDQEAWLRSLFHARDPEAYVALLRTDLRSDRPGLVIDSIHEITRRHPGAFLDDLQPLLDAADPAVACVAAFAILGLERRLGYDIPQRAPAVARAAEAAKTDPGVRAAWETISRLAADPATPIPAGTSSYGGNVRTDSLWLLRSKACPPPWHWDDQRIDEQIANPAERDARMLRDLLLLAGQRKVSSSVHFRAEHPNFAPPESERSEVIAVWRRCLTEPYSYGTLEAIGELAALGDRESLPRMRSIVDKIAASCATGVLPGEGAEGARYPWATRFNIENLREAMAKLDD
jgi:hypothetical protein